MHRCCCCLCGVQMLQSCLGAIVDLENLHIALDGMFTVDERNEAVHRMGLLNLYDPMHAERVYRLDLRKHDNRWVRVVLGVRPLCAAPN